MVQVINDHSKHLPHEFMASVTSFKSFVETEFGDTTIVGLPGSLAQCSEFWVSLIHYSVLCVSFSSSVRLGSWIFQYFWFRFLWLLIGPVRVFVSSQCVCFQYFLFYFDSNSLSEHSAACESALWVHNSAWHQAVPHSQYYHQFHFGFKHTFEVKRRIKQEALQKGPVELKSYLWLLPFQKGSPQQEALNI